MEVSNKPITLILFDTAGTLRLSYCICINQKILTVGQEDYDRLRPLSYANSNVFVVCFSIGSRTSFENVKDKWVPELRKHAPNTPILLVGTQSDRRQSTGGTQLISEGEARKLAKAIKAAGYIECSAKNRDGVKGVFSEAVLVALDPVDRAKKNMKGSGGSNGSKCMIS